MFLTWVQLYARQEHLEHCSTTLFAPALCHPMPIKDLFIISLKNRQLLQFCFGCSGCRIRADKFLWFKFFDVLPEREIKSIKEEKVIKVYKCF